MSSIEHGGGGWVVGVVVLFLSGGRCCGCVCDVCVLAGRILEIFGVLDLNTIELDFSISSNIEKTSTQTRVGSRIWIWNLPPIESSLRGWGMV